MSEGRMMEFPNSDGSNWEGSMSSGSESESETSSIRALRDIVAEFDVECSEIGNM